jgi:hypothetical protein
MKLMRHLHVVVSLVVLAVALSACAVTGSTLGQTPEAQIVNGANSVTAATTLATTLLKNDRINVTQAKGYRAILGTASGHLDSANAALVACRKKTGSTSATNPDPCAPTVTDDIALALAVVGEVKKTLDAKQ